jgi:phosphoglycolate phosphatase-like HAD superfamily hydrolase
MSRKKEFKKDAVVFDLDGTLVDVMDYEKHHKHKNIKFAKEAEEADAIDKNVKQVKKAEKKGKEVVILTARSGHYKKQTKDWLKKHDIKEDKLIMRPSNDSKTPDKDIKEKLLKKEILPKYKVGKAYDDKNKNVKMFKKNGIKAKEI